MFKIFAYKLLFLAALQHPTYVPPEAYLNDPDYQAAAKAVVQDLEVADRVFFYNQATEYNTNTFRELRARYQELEHAPRFRDALLLPDKDFLWGRLEILRGLRKTYNDAQAIEPDKDLCDYLEGKVADLQTLAELFLRARWAYDGHDVYNCRIYLKEIRSRVGYGDYYTQTWPVFTPLWLFRTLE